MAGIISYGAYIPRYRIRAEDIAEAWGKNPADIKSSLKINEKSVPAFDEDSVTMGIESSSDAFKRISFAPEKIGSVFMGSESHPYAVNPSSTIVADMLGIGPEYLAGDLEFACKAATTGMQITGALVDSKRVDYGLVVGSDTAQAKPQDALEYTAAAASCAFILGAKKEETVASVLTTSSVASDTPDFWRREGQKFPSHAGRFTGEPSYFTHVLLAANLLLKKSQLAPTDFKYCIFHMPNGKFPRVAAKKMGFSDEQLKLSLVVESVGNSYTASALMGLCNILDIANPNEKIFFVSYGSGAGSDGFIFETTENLSKIQKRGTQVKDLIAQKQYINYVQYLKQIHQI